MEDFNLHCYETKIKVKTKTVLTNQTTFQRFWLAAKSKTQKNLVSTVYGQINQADKSKCQISKYQNSSKRYLAGVSFKKLQKRQKIRIAEVKIHFRKNSN